MTKLQHNIRAAVIDSLLILMFYCFFGRTGVGIAVLIILIAQGL